MQRADEQLEFPAFSSAARSWLWFVGGRKGTAIVSHSEPETLERHLKFNSNLSSDTNLELDAAIWNPGEQTGFLAVAYLAPSCHLPTKQKQQANYKPNPLA